MPFIVTTSSPCPNGHTEPLLQGDGGGWDGSYYHTPQCDVCDDRCEVIVSRSAVATLEGREVWNALYGVEIKGREEVVEMIASLPECGGTVGPLPDGTVIEVEAIGAIDLFNRAGLPKGPPYKSVAEVVAAFNARESA